MALPDDQELKAYLRVTTDVEDDLIEGINLAAQAWLAAYYNTPLESETRTFDSRYPRKGKRGELSTQLVVPVIPCDTAATITDIDGNEVDSDTYTVNARSGLIDTVRYEVFDNPPYDIELAVGWANHPDFDTRVDPILRQAAFWAASTYYRNRNVAAIYEQSGGQVSITYTEEEIPKLLRALLTSLKYKGRPY
jgi:hypothetical protein